MSAERAPEVRRAVVTASALRLRDAPEVMALALSSVPRGTVVDLLGTTPDGHWVQVKVGRRVGWMSRKYLMAPDHPLAPKSVREEFAWMAIATAELGVAEQVGPGSSPRVVEYLGSTSLHAALAKDDATPWCSAFVNWCVERAGFAGTDSALAKSWLGWGRAIELPRRGCIAVFTRGESGGHVGFFARRTSTHIEVLGGNQDDRVSVAGYAPGRLLGYRVSA